MTELKLLQSKNKISKSQFKETVLSDYRLASEVRESGLQGRRDVRQKKELCIFGDGKELA